jgi:hypothetical protein
MRQKVIAAFQSLLSVIEYGEKCRSSCYSVSLREYSSQIRYPPMYINIVRENLSVSILGK